MQQIMGVMESPVVEAPKATLYVERKVQVRDYESLVVGMHFPVDLPLLQGEGDEAVADYFSQLDAALKTGFTTIKSHIYEQLGLAYDDVNGVMVERVTAKFSGTAEVQPSTFKPVSNTPSIPQAPAGAGHPDFGKCPKCGGTEFWDNRSKKAAGEYKQSAPDGKCKDKECKNGVWLKK